MIHVGINVVEALSLPFTLSCIWKNFKFVKSMNRRFRRPSYLRKRWTAAFGRSDVMGFRLWLEKFARSLDKSRNLHTLDSVPYGTAINEENQNFVKFSKISKFSRLRLTFNWCQIIRDFFWFLTRKSFLTNFQRNFVFLSRKYLCKFMSIF